MRAWLRTDLGRAKYLLYAFIIVSTIAFAWFVWRADRSFPTRLHRISWDRT